MSNKTQGAILSATIAFLGVVIMSGAVTPKEVEIVNHECVEGLTVDLEQNRGDVLCKLRDIENALLAIHKSILDTPEIKVHSQTVNVEQDTLMSTYIKEAQGKRLNDEKP